MIGGARPMPPSGPMNRSGVTRSWSKDGSGEVVALVLGAILLGPGVLCELAGGIGALLSHGHFVSAPAAAVVALPIGILRHPLAPALAGTADGGA